MLLNICHTLPNLVIVYQMLSQARLYSFLWLQLRIHYNLTVHHPNGIILFWMWGMVTLNTTPTVQCSTVQRLLCLLSNGTCLSPKSATNYRTHSVYFLTWRKEKNNINNCPLHMGGLRNKWVSSIRKFCNIENASQRRNIIFHCSASSSEELFNPAAKSSSILETEYSACASRM